MNHSQWKTRRTRKLTGETVEESQAYIEARYAFALGQAVYDRRTELGLTQNELARRAEMTLKQISQYGGAGLTVDGLYGPRTAQHMEFGNTQNRCWT